MDHFRPELTGSKTFFLVAAAAVFLTACGSGESRFGHTFESPEALASEVLRALEARDLERLEALPLSEKEFRDDVFREMPAFGRVPSDYAWRDLRQKSGHSLRRVLDAHGGRAYELKKVLFGPTTSYRSFVVLRKARLLVRDKATGEEKQVDLFGSVLACSRRYKLFSYVVNR